MFNNVITGKARIDCEVFCYNSRETLVFNTRCLVTIFIKKERVFV